jgi:L-threonylcarbamoyladenylate synthase
MILRFDPSAPDPGLLGEAAGIIARAGLVIFPTETVYGLGADLRCAEAVKRVCELKHRPSSQPLLVHCSAETRSRLTTKTQRHKGSGEEGNPQVTQIGSREESVESAKSADGEFAGLVAEVPAHARRLMDAFWPGPLALVFRARKGLPPAVTGPNATVGIRMVAHPATCALIAELGSPLAGTSANLHGEPATSDFSKLNPELLGGVDIALDAGVCGTGKASTVLDVSCSPPVLLREGAVPRQAIERLLGFNLATATRTQWNRR